MGVEIVNPYIFKPHLLFTRDFCFLILLKEWIMEQWEKNYYISAVAGVVNGSSLVVMSKGWFLVRYILAYVLWQSSTLHSVNLDHGFQAPSICSNHTKSVIHFLSNGLTKSGRRAFM